MDDQATLSFTGDCVRSLHTILSQLLLQLCNLPSVSFVCEFACIRLLLYMVEEISFVLLQTFQLHSVSVDLPLRTSQLHRLGIELRLDLDAQVLIRFPNLEVVR